MPERTPEPAHDPVLQEFLDEHPRWKPDTRENYLRWLRYLFAFLQQQRRPWTETSRHDLVFFEQRLQWTTHSQGGLYTENSVFMAMRVARLFFRWAVRVEKLRRNPMHGWILRAPRPRPERQLERAETMRLLNLPDVTTPIGQRDALLLELLYHAELTFRECRQMRLDQVNEMGFERGVQAALQRYVQDGRRQQERVPQQHLLLTDFGEPFRDNPGLRARLKILGDQIGYPNLSPRILHKSHRAHQDELYQRRLPF